MAKKESVKINVNVRELKNLQYGEKFKTVSNSGILSKKTYTKEEYDRNTKKYDIGNNSKQLKGSQKVVTDLNYCDINKRRF